MSQAAKEAATAYEQKDGPKSAKLCGQLVQTAPDARAWYRLGVSLNKIGEHEKPLEAFAEGRALGWPPQFVKYGIAVVFASVEENQKAQEHLEKATQTGWSQPEATSE